MKRVVITGGTGFIGANLARRLLREGHEVHLLVRSGYNPQRIEDIASELWLHRADFADIYGLTRELDLLRADWIFHLAANGAYAWQDNAAQILHTNVNGTANLVEAAIKVGFEAFVNSGSSAEYGFKAHAPLEDECLEPNSLYAVAKASATMYARYSAVKHQVRLSTLRLYSVYGPYEDSVRLIPALMRCGLKGELPPLVNPNLGHDYVYIDDVCDAYLRAASNEEQECGAIYNVGTGVQTSLEQVVEIARRTLKIQVEPEWDTTEGPLCDTDSRIANNQKIQRELGWTPKYSLEEGFKAALPWFEKQTRE